MKRALLAATAVLSTAFTPIAMAPAYAAVGDPVTDPDILAQLNAYCRTIVPPGDSDAPPLEITAINVIEGITTPGSGITITLVDGTEHRHGGSPNIFENAHETSITGSTSYTFDCQTKNTASGTFPDGLQFPGQTTTLEDTNGASTDTDVVVCNSPTKNPGVWRAQNGYLGDCNAEGAIFYSLPIFSAQTVWNPIPSNSLPD